MILAFLLMFSYMLTPWRSYTEPKTVVVIDDLETATPVPKPVHPAAVPSTATAPNVYHDDGNDDGIMSSQYIPGPHSTPKKFFKSLFELYYTYRPNLGKKLDNYPNGKAPTDGGMEKHPFDLKELSGYLKINETDLEQLRKTHQALVDNLPLTYPEKFYKGTGIVIVGGGGFMPVAVSCIRMLRRLNQDIPVELFYEGEKEYEPKLCDEVLPSLNAKCVSLHDSFGKEVMKNFAIKGYQYKGLALLASSFEKTLLLDADNLPIRDPSELFMSDPFKETGYILWPDYWRRTTSPDFYNITGVQLGERIRGDLTSNTRVPLHHLEGSMPDMATESGQIAIDKRRHFRSLLLSTYYNIYGYSTYYPLLSQGAMGEGDKETFAAAATVLDEPVYYINSMVGPSGWHGPDNYHGVAMQQMHPQMDYELHVLKNTNKPAMPMFVHNHMNKMNPMRIVLGSPLRYPSKGEVQNFRNRFYGKLTDCEREFGTRPSPITLKPEPLDLEVQIWEEGQWMVCDMALKQNVSFLHWEESYTREEMVDVCDRIHDHIEWLRVNPNNPGVLLPEEQKEWEDSQKAQKQEKLEKSKKKETGNESA